ncbi:hypothetical protein FDECE_8334 [Fusarium decemcellulare]|nr:hypothetical protein FDECE_8334 [Fusarium decemcellulare]
MSRVLLLDQRPSAMEKLSYLSRSFTLIPPTPSTHDYYAVEARATLDLADSESAIRHALTCLDALRAHYEEHGDPTRSYHVSAHSGFQFGLQEYTHAVRALSGRMSVCGGLGHERNLHALLKAALLCSQLFISIEIALNDIHDATQHFICGLQLMHRYGTRPFVVENENDQLTVVVPPFARTVPDISLFIVKLYLSCPGQLFCFPSSAAESSTLAQPKTPDDRDPKSPNQCATDDALLQARQHLARIATSTISLLQGIGNLHQSLDWSSRAKELLSERQDILCQLEQTCHGIEPLRQLYTHPTRHTSSKKTALAAAFTNLFYSCLMLTVFLTLQGPGKLTDSWKEESHEIVLLAGVVTRLMGK